jgi:hypothetical protein
MFSSQPFLRSPAFTAFFSRLTTKTERDSGDQSKFLTSLSWTQLSTQDHQHDNQSPQVY